MVEKAINSVKRAKKRIELMIPTSPHRPELYNVVAQLASALYHLRKVKNKL